MGKKQKFYGYYLPATNEQGIVTSWEECQAKVQRQSRPRYKACKTKEEAEEWLKGFLKRENKEFAIEINFDGACEPNNNGTASYGWLIKKDGVVIAQDAQLIGKGEYMTNNFAEYTGLIKALEQVKDLKLEGSIKIHGDSDLVCRMISKEWGWKDKKKTIWMPHKDAPHLAAQLERALKLLESREFEIEWVPREQNQAADDLSKKPLIEAGIIKPDSEKEMCDKCGGRMFPRKGPYGLFLGCENYPKCRGIKKIASKH